jgi:hypothetical protein
VVSCGVVRLLLTLWLAAFAVQSVELPMLLAPDGCTEETRGSASDPCPESCPRCLCCARVPAFVPQDATPVPAEPVAHALVLPALDPSTTPSPHGIYHVPKSS